MEPLQSNYGWRNANPTPAHNYILPAVLKLLPEKKPLSILDAGCGNGFLAGKLAQLGHKVIGVDISTDGIDIARNKYPDIPFFVASLYEDLSPIAKGFDLVVSSEVIEHLYHPGLFLENMHRVLYPGGQIILSTPYHGYFKNLMLALLNRWDSHHTSEWEGGHIKFFSEASLSNLLGICGYKNVVFHNAGRIPLFWKSMVCRAETS